MKSQYDDRDTVGTTYLKAQKNSTDGLVLKDIGTEMTSSLVKDLNEAITSNPFEGRPFYINIVEERDLQMKNALKRRLFKSLYRPYPEDNTLVFFVDPRKNIVNFCWDLPHHSELYNILYNAALYDHKYIRMIKDWMNHDLTSFGYVKVSINSSQIEGYDEKTINSYRENYLNFCKSREMNEKEIEEEKRLGFFWIPNKFKKDQDVTHKSPIPSIS